MEPNKLEKHFKKQLNSREIQPSEMAWSKLDAMLAAAEPSNSEQAKQKPKTKFPWMYVAASFVGFLLLRTVYFNQNSSEIINQKNEVVIQNDAATKPTVVSDNDTNLQTEEAIVVVSKTNQGRSIKNPILKQKSDIVSSNINQNHLIAVSINNLLKENTISDNSIQELNYKVTDKNRYVSAEKLLADVTNTKLESQSMDKSANKTTTIIAVSPNLLLQNAETELNRSFRESALNKFNKNFNAIKTVLANRNYEE